ncbi:MAG: small ribosomal subunit Rsm22 family protein [Bryobacteraceae bacterium]
MRLPEWVRKLIEERAAEAPFAELKRGAAALSEGYRAGRGTRGLRAPVAAYLVTRMPATYAAAYAALSRLDVQPRSLLDAGGGTGSASLAARELFPSLETTTIFEADPRLAEAGRGFLGDAEWRIGDFTRAELPPAGLVVAGYSLAEVRDPVAAALRLWEAARIALVVIEPGTPRGFGTVQAIRERLLAAGARIAAPCPHEGACPAAGAGWCHFAARLERSSLHRRLKGGELSYEDEKYSYMAFTREPARTPQARIVRHPHTQPGQITLELCKEGKLTSERVPRGDRERFRKARKAAWGDGWE